MYQESGMTDTTTILDTTKEKCAENEDRFYVEVSGYCTHCDNQTAIENSTQAECEVCANRIWTAEAGESTTGTCQLCEGGKIRQEGICVCPSEKQYWDGTSCVETCPMYYEGTTCVSSCTGVNKYYNGTKCSTSCPKYIVIQRV